MQPQRKLGDLDGGRVQIDAIDIFREDIRDQRRFRYLRFGKPKLVPFRRDALLQQTPKRRDQKGAGAAGGIDDAHRT